MLRNSVNHLGELLDSFEQTSCKFYETPRISLSGSISQAQSFLDSADSIFRRA